MHRQPVRGVWVSHRWNKSRGANNLLIYDNLPVFSKICSTSRLTQTGIPALVHDRRYGEICGMTHGVEQQSVDSNRKCMVSCFKMNFIANRPKASSTLRPIHTLAMVIVVMYQSSRLPNSMSNISFLIVFSSWWTVSLLQSSYMDEWTSSTRELSYDW